MIDQIIAVVVIYNAKIEESKTLISLAKSLALNSKTMDLIVYDNSLQPCFENSSSFVVGFFNIHYVHDPSNPGVSKAYNFSAHYAQKLKKRWILLLDQDTIFPIDAISSYISGIQSHPDIKLFTPILKLSDDTIISPSNYRFKRGFALKNISPGLHSLKNISPLNSGMLINIDAFTSVGGYNEKVKLDFSDFQFIERFKKWFDQFYVLNVICLHDFSNEETSSVKLNNRFRFYCEGAKNSERGSFGDRFIYFMVVLLRATKLVYRTKNIVFYKTFLNYYLR
jgi:GT2 family glycosyltransferase